MLRNVSSAQLNTQKSFVLAIWRLPFQVTLFQGGWLQERPSAFWLGLCQRPSTMVEQWVGGAWGQSICPPRSLSGAWLWLAVALAKPQLLSSEWSFALPSLRALVSIPCSFIFRPQGVPALHCHWPCCTPSLSCFPAHVFTNCPFIKFFSVSRLQCIICLDCDLPGHLPQAPKKWSKCRGSNAPFHPWYVWGEICLLLLVFIFLQEGFYIFSSSSTCPS